MTQSKSLVLLSCLLVSYCNCIFAFPVAVCITLSLRLFQSVGDVLRERFAVEMKCNTALRLAALHMHERLDSCGQTRTSIKSIT